MPSAHRLRSAQTACSSAHSRCPFPRNARPTQMVKLFLGEFRGKADISQAENPLPRLNVERRTSWAEPKHNIRVEFDWTSLNNRISSTENLRSRIRL